MPLVTEDWPKRRWRPGRDGSRYFEISDVADEAAALAALADENVAEGGEWPIVAGETISIAAGDIEFTRKGRNYLAVASYSPGAAGSFTPTEQKWQCRLSWLIEERPMLRDGADRAIVNSNRDPIQTNLARRRKVPVLEMVRWETGADIIAKALAYTNRWNNASVTFPKIGTAAKGEALLDAIEVVEDFSSLSNKLRVMYRFIFRPRMTLKKPDGTGTEQRHGFYAPVPDVGFMANDAGVGRRILWGPDRLPDGGTPVPFPVMLNGLGSPKNTGYKFMAKLGGGPPNLYDFDDRTDGAPTYYTTGSDGTQLYYDTTDGEANLNDLSIAANI